MCKYVSRILLASFILCMSPVFGDVNVLIVGPSQSSSTDNPPTSDPNLKDVPFDLTGVKEHLKQILDGANLGTVHIAYEDTVIRPPEDYGNRAYKLIRRSLGRKV